MYGVLKLGGGLSSEALALTKSVADYGPRRRRRKNTQPVCYDWLEHIVQVFEQLFSNH